MYKLRDKEIQEQGNDEANSPLRNKSNANTQNTSNPNLEGKNPAITGPSHSPGNLFVADTPSSDRTTLTGTTLTENPKCLTHKQPPNGTLG